MDIMSKAKKSMTDLHSRYGPMAPRSVLFHPDKPSPLDFAAFMTWACKQYNIAMNVTSRYCFVQNKSLLSQHQNKGKMTIYKRKYKEIDSRSTLKNKSSITLMDIAQQNPITVIVTYDSQDKLESITLTHNPTIPRTVFQVLALVVVLQTHLTTLIIDTGIDEYSIYEISQFLPTSTLTNICLDGTYMKNPNYHMLLESASKLNYLSLSRCKITDQAVQKISETLIYSQPSEKTLIYLNLSSNLISDEGAKYLAETLQSNRHLAYLNLANNTLSDIGAASIFDSLLNFRIPHDDMLQSHLRHLQFIKEKDKLIAKYQEELMHSRKLSSNISLKRKVRARSNSSSKSIQSNKSSRSRSKEQVRSYTSLNEFHAKAESMAETALGEFQDPFQSAKTFSHEGHTYCAGNHTLTCLNLAYNNLTYLSLKKVVGVLMHQAEVNRKPRGLIRLRLEGNYLPKNCEEYAQIGKLLALALNSEVKTQSKSTQKNRTTSLAVNKEVSSARGKRN